MPRNILRVASSISSHSKEKSVIFQYSFSTSQQVNIDHLSHHPGWKTRKISFPSIYVRSDRAKSGSGAQQSKILGENHCKLLPRSQKNLFSAAKVHSTGIRGQKCFQRGQGLFRGRISLEPISRIIINPFARCAVEASPIFNLYLNVLPGEIWDNKGITLIQTSILFPSFTFSPIRITPMPILIL